MIAANEILPGLWLFSGDPSGRNSVIATWGEGQGGKALLVDPGPPDATVKFLLDAGVQAEAIAYTDSSVIWTRSEFESPPNGAVLRLTPDLFPERRKLDISLAGWEAIPLQAEGTERMALYKTGERILVPGDILPDPAMCIPNLKYGTESYLANLETLEALDPKLVVPWRGRPASGKRAIKTRIENDRNYIHSLVRHVATSAASGIPLQRMLDVAASLYDDFPHLDAHLANMRYIWEELQHGPREFRE